MKKLTLILLSSILLTSNSYSNSFERLHYSSNFDNKCSLDLVKTSSDNSFGSKNTNYNSDIDDNIINDDTNDNIMNDNDDTKNDTDNNIINNDDNTKSDTNDNIINNDIEKELDAISEKHAQEGNDDISEIIQIIQNTLNLDIFKKAIASINDDINYFINSRKFKMIGNLHQQIVIGADNGNTIYNRFSIDDNILNDYNNYYKQLVNFTSTLFGKKIIGIIGNDYDSRIEQIRNIISGIYNKLEDVDELEDIDDIIYFFIKDEIDSERNLQGNNILKIMANLAVAIHDCTQNAQYTCLQLTFGPKIRIGNNIIMESSTYFEVLRQFKIIIETFGIEVKK